MAVKKAKTRKKTIEKEEHFNKCIRCQKTFSSRKALKKHSKLHLAELKEMQMLEKGYIPSQSKIGSEFRGKNKIVVT